jgi:hypothetical protein
MRSHSESSSSQAGSSRSFIDPGVYGPAKRRPPVGAPATLTAVPETYRVAWQGEDGPRPSGPTVTLDAPPAEGETIHLDDGTRVAVEHVQEIAHWRPVVWARRLPKSA